MMHSIVRTRAASPLNLTLITLLALIASLSDARAQPNPCGSDIQSIEINQTTLHYFECGQGEPLVFVHGTTGNLRSFRRQVEVFAANFRVVAYSRRYHPPNAPPRAGDDNHLRVHVADLAELVRVLKVAPAHLVGHSYGAYIALALALEQPNLVRSLALGEPPIFPLLARTSVGKALSDSFLKQVVSAARHAFESGDSEEGVRRFLDGVCGTGCFDRLPHPERTALVERQGPALRLDMQSDMSAVLPPLACETLSGLRRPTLLVTGERSPAVFLLTTAELERCLEGESQVMVPEAGHVMPMDNPTFFNEAVMAFLQRSGGLR